MLDVLAKGGEQILEEHDGKIPGADGVAEGEEHRIGLGIRDSGLGIRMTRCNNAPGCPQPPAPVVEERGALGRRAVALVGEVVGRAGEGVDGRDVRAHRGREQ